jgi:hypothetical protein
MRASERETWCLDKVNSKEELYFSMLRLGLDSSKLGWWAPHQQRIVRCVFG